MNNRSMEIIEESIVNGRWVWLEVDSNSKSLYLEFENLQLLSKAIVNKFKPINQLDIISKNTNNNDYRGELALRFAQNISLTIFYNDLNPLSFLNSDKNYLNNLFSSDSTLTDEETYFYKDFSLEIKNFKFQDYEYLENIIEFYNNCKVLINFNNEKDNSLNYIKSNDFNENSSNHIKLSNFFKENDFILTFECDNIAIVVSGNSLTCFNDFESLNDEDIKRSSNDWILYCLDYLNKKGSKEEYKEDLLCENFL